MASSTATELDSYQQAALDRARAVLAQEHGYDAASLAARSGSLEWHLQEMIHLVGQLTGGAR